MSSVKEEAKKLIDRLPDQVTWDDIMYEFYVKKKIATGIKAVEEGRIVSHEEVKKRFLSKGRLRGTLAKTEGEYKRR
jgi:predicted transcriptional regulator